MKAGKLLVWVASLYLLGAALFECHAQPPRFQWAIQGQGTGGYDQIYGVATDRDGNILTTGFYESTQISLGGITLVSGRTTNNISSIYGNFFLFKQDALGHALWALQSGSVNSTGAGCATDPSGNVFVTGYYETPTFDLAGSVLTNNGLGNAFLAKLDPAGNLLWLKAGSSAETIVESIAVNQIGEAFIAGVLFSTNAIYGRNAFVAKYDGDGNVLWAREILGGAYDYETMAAGPNGDCRITGGFIGTVDFGGQSLTNPINTFGSYLASYDAGGALLWATQAGVPASPYYSHVAVDGAGNSFVVGPFQSAQLSIGSMTLTNPTGSGLFLAKYDGGGNVLWAVGGYASDYVQGEIVGIGITADAAGNCFLAGTVVAGGIDFGNGWSLTNRAGTDLNYDNDMGFVAKFSSNGSPLWAKGVSTTNDYGGVGFIALAEDRAQGIVCIGWVYDGMADFDGVSLTNNTSGVFLVTRLNGPLLTINLLGSQVQLAWPTNALGLHLDTSSALPGAPWLPLTNTPAVSGQSQTVTLDVSPPAGFFRLSDGSGSP